MRWLTLGLLPFTKLCWRDQPSECAHLGDEIAADGIDQGCDGEYLVDHVALSSLSAVSISATATDSGDDGGYTLLSGYDLLATDQDSPVASDIVVGAPYSNLVYVISGDDLTSASTGELSAIRALTFSAAKVNNAGAALAAGDANGDLHADLLVGARTYDFAGDTGTGVASVGAAHLLRGPLDQLSSVNLDDASVILRGTTDTMEVGSAVSMGNFMGDTDGFDLAIGAPGYQDSEPRGAVGLMKGGPDLSDLDAEFHAPDDCDAGASCLSGILTGRVADWGAGNAVAAVPGLGGDGTDGLLVGARRANDQTGVAWLFMGEYDEEVRLSAATGALEMPGARDDEYAGTAVADAGDVNGGGKHDLLIGTVSASDGGGMRTGRVYLVLGETAQDYPSGGTLSLADADTIFQWDAHAIGDSCALASLGDIDGDGLADLAIGAPEDDNTGGDSAGVVFIVPGSSLQGASFALGAAGETSVLSSFQLDDAPLKLKGDEPSQRVGHALAGGTDLDGDGVPDLLVAAPGSQSSASSNAAIYLLSGADMASTIAAR